MQSVFAVHLYKTEALQLTWQGKTKTEEGQDKMVCVQLENWDVGVYVGRGWCWREKSRRTNQEIFTSSQDCTHKPQKKKNKKKSISFWIKHIIYSCTNDWSKEWAISVCAHVVLLNCYTSFSMFWCPEASVMYWWLSMIAHSAVNVNYKWIIHFTKMALML